MRTRYLLLPFALVLVLALAAGCARQLTKAESSRLEAIAAKIAEAEALGAAKSDCAPRELARAKAELAHATHELTEHTEQAEEAVRAAEKAADELLAKARLCGKKEAAPAAAPAPAAEVVKPEAEPQAPAPAQPPAAGPVKGLPGATGVESAKEGPSGFENIHFDFDKSFIRNDAKPILARVAEYLKSNPNDKLLVEGHCDERGTAEYNMALGQRRADSAKSDLVNLGIAESRISTISYGKEKPIDPGHNEDAWAKNRRAVFVVR